MNTSSVTPVQSTYQMAVEAGKQELVKHFGDSNLSFTVVRLSNHVKVSATNCDDIQRHTIIEFMD